MVVGRPCGSSVGGPSAAGATVGCHPATVSRGSAGARGERGGREGKQHLTGKGKEVSRNRNTIMASVTQTGPGTVYESHHDGMSK